MVPTFHRIGPAALLRSRQPPLNQSADRDDDARRSDQLNGSFPAFIYRRERWCLLPVLLGVVLASFRSMVGRMLRVAVGGVGVMRCLLMIAALVMLGGFSVMARGVLVVIGSARMVLCTLVLGRHGLSSSGCR